MSIYTMNQEAIDAVHLFIAEILGYKRGTVQGKLEFGRKAEQERTIKGSLDERIWLERLYEELFKLRVHESVHGSYEGFHWSVPIELDASALG